LGARAEQPPGCQTSGSFVTITVLPSQPAYAVGQQVRYVVTMENPTLNGAGLANCNISNVSMTLTLPNNVVVPVLTNQNLAAGANAIVCPGDPACLSPSNAFNYIISQADVRSIDVNTCPATSGTTRAFTAVVHREGTVALGTFGAGLNDNKCANAPVVQPCLTCTKTCVNATGPNGSITFSGSVINCDTNAGFLGTLQGVNIVDVVNGVTNVIASNISLTNGQVFPFSGSYTNPNPCAPITDTVSASGVTAAGTTVATSCSATCSNILTPRLVMQKLCPATNGLPGGVLGFTGTITNTGNVTITNIVIVNNVPAANTPVTIIASLAPGAGAAFSGVDAIPLNTCTLPDTLTATGRDICGTLVTTNASANCPISCLPALKVYKQVVCYSNACEPFNADLTTQKTAAGVRIDPANDANCPAFCYRIIVTNQGNVTLSNLVVFDSNSSDGKVLNLSGCGFPSFLAPGASASCIVTTNHCVNSTNIVTATAVGQTSPSGTTTLTSTDTNRVSVVPISIDCRLLVSTNNGASFAPYSSPNCATQLITQPYIIRVVVTNTGSYPLANVVVTDTAGTLASCLADSQNDCFAGCRRYIELRLHEHLQCGWRGELCSLCHCSSITEPGSYLRLQHRWS
jgi:hypothetical protein